MTPHPGRNEHTEQATLFEWANLMVNTGKYPELYTMFAIPNWRPKQSQRAYLAAEGVKPGIPDIFLPVPRRGYHGMFIELKVGKNQPTEGQRAYQKVLHSLGYYVVTLWGFEKAKKEIEFYLNEEIEQNPT